MKNTLYIQFVIISGLFSLYSCKSSYREYGQSIVKFSNDSVNTVLAKRSLNNLPDQDFLSLSFLTKEKQVIPYRLLTPINPNPVKKYPLIITFHNSTRIGTDNKSQLEPMARIWLNGSIRKKYQTYVLAPQFAERSANYHLDQQRGILTSSPSLQLQAIPALIDSLKKTYPIDVSRIYLLGYSMGGSAVIELLNLRPGIFAAAVAIAAVPAFGNVNSLERVPIWLIHGSADTENPFAGSRELYREISVRHKTKFSIYEQRTHDNIVSTALLGESIPQWLFARKLKAIQH